MKPVRTSLFSRIFPSARRSLQIVVVAVAASTAALAFAKGVGGTGGGAGGRSVGSGFAASGGAGGAALATVSLGSGGSNSLSSVFAPTMFPSSAFDPSLFPYGQTTALPPMPSWGVWAPACITGGAGLMGLVGDQLGASSHSGSDLAERAADDVEPYYPKGVDADRGRRYGASINGLFRNGEKGCEKFITKDGKIGPWGNYALDQIKDPKHNGVFDAKVPDDIKQYCPNFASIQADPARMQYFWLYMMAALAKPESSCAAGAVNGSAPNGAALGLYQLEPSKCNGMSSQDLMDPYKNIHCAVDVLGHEMSCRSTLKTTTSKGGRNRCGTYWGELRSDPYGAGDQGAATRFNNMISDYTDCKITTANVRAPAQTK